MRQVDGAVWTDQARLTWMEVQYADGSPETYVVADRLDDPTVGRGLLDQLAARAVVGTDAGGTLVFRPTHLFGAIARERTEPISVLRGEQSNTSLRYGDALILKLFRRVQFGPNPDVEIGWFLTEHSGFRNAPAVVGSIEYTPRAGDTAALALVQCFVPNRGDAWTTTLARLETVLAGGDPRESVEAMARLGRTTAELHLALASGSGDFSAEPITTQDVAAWDAAIHAELDAAVAGLLRRGIAVDASALRHRADGIRALRGAEKTRHHGDYHLGQVLENQDGAFVVIDFEGEPAKPLAQRREKRSPLRDVAGILRSFDYARNAALRAADATDPHRVERASRWYGAVREAFLRTYLEHVGEGRPSLLPADVHAPLAALELDKAAYEVLYELNNRPDWLPIPLAALQA